MHYQNRYQQNQAIYIEICEYGFDLEGKFKVKVNQVIDEQAKIGDDTHKVLLHVQPKQAEIIQYLQDKKAKTWHLITAFEPRGEARHLGDEPEDKAENHRLNLIAHQDLIQTVQKLGYQYQVCNCGDLKNETTPKHIEESLLIFNISEQQALMLAKQFRQNAWVGGDLMGNVCLYWEPEAKLEMLGLPPKPNL